MVPERDCSRYLCYDNDTRRPRTRWEKKDEKNVCRFAISSLQRIDIYLPLESESMVANRDRHDVARSVSIQYLLTFSSIFFVFQRSIVSLVGKVCMM